MGNGPKVDGSVLVLRVCRYCGNRDAGTLLAPGVQQSWFLEVLVGTFTASDLDREPTVRPAMDIDDGQQQAATVAVAMSAVEAGIDGCYQNCRFGAHLGRRDRDVMAWVEGPGRLGVRMMRSAGRGTPGPFCTQGDKEYGSHSSQ